MWIFRRDSRVRHPVAPRLVRLPAIPEQPYGLRKFPENGKLPDESVHVPLVNMVPAALTLANTNPERFPAGVVLALAPIMKRLMTKPLMKNDESALRRTPEKLDSDPPIGTPVICQLFPVAGLAETEILQVPSASSAFRPRRNCLTSNFPQSMPNLSPMLLASASVNGLRLEFDIMFFTFSLGQPFQYLDVLLIDQFDLNPFEHAQTFGDQAMFGELQNSLLVTGAYTVGQVNRRPQIG